MAYKNPSDSETFQVNPDDLLSSYPQFNAAGDAIRNAATDLNSAVTKAISAFDGNTHKNLQTLGNTCETNLQGLANAMDEIATRLYQSALAFQHTEGHNTRLFQLNS